MNNETLDRLNVFVADYKKESEEKDAIIKKQNQTLLHISAELEAIKQDPFDPVLIAGSIKNISNIIKGEAIIDDGCVGCAGPCMVVDVAAKMQKEPNSVMVQLVDSRNRCGYLSTQIEVLKDRNIEDLKELYDLYEAELRGIKADRTSIKSDRDIMFRNYRNTVAKLQGDIKGLEAELSTRKGDSDVLAKVVDVANRWSDERIASRPAINQIAYLVKDYHDAPEEHKTPIDDLYKVTVTYAFLEMP